MSKGRLISFEGGDGVGKSTQIGQLESYLRDFGLNVVRVREPGSTPGAERIRRIILEGEPDDWLPMSELLLMNAARHDLIERIIKPALDNGSWVVADRFADSSRAYQIAAGELNPALAENVIQAATGGLEPDLTILLEFPMAEAFARIEQQGGTERRFETKGVEFQRKALNAFYYLHERYPQRVARVSAKGKVEEVRERIIRLLETTFDLPMSAPNGR